MTLMTLSQNEHPVPNGFRVDISRGERVETVAEDRVSSPPLTAPIAEDERSHTRNEKHLD